MKVVSKNPVGPTFGSDDSFCVNKAYSSQKYKNIVPVMVSKTNKAAE